MLIPTLLSLALATPAPSLATVAQQSGFKKTGRYEEVVRIDGTVPDGLAFDDAGGVVISCYRPDRVYHLSAAGELTILAEDPQGTLLAAPTNVCFAGAQLDRIVVANLGRWHLTALDDTGLRGTALHRP
jgi:gluconolactonase